MRRAREGDEARPKDRGSVDAAEAEAAAAVQAAFRPGAPRTFDFATHTLRGALWTLRGGVDETLGVVAAGARGLPARTEQLPAPVVLADVDNCAAATDRGVVLHQLRLGPGGEGGPCGLPGLFVLLAAHRREELAQGSVLPLRRRRGCLVRRHGPRRGRRTRDETEGAAESVRERRAPGRRGGVARGGLPGRMLLRSCVLVDATFGGKH